MTGIEESGAKPIPLGSTPAITSCAPRAATMAPLSVHSDSGGTVSRIPAALQRCSVSWRSRELAATPPPSRTSVMPFSRQASTALDGDDIHHGFLEGRGDVRHGHLLAAGLELLHAAGDGGLEPAEGPVVAVRPGFLGGAHVLGLGEAAREPDGFGVAGARELVDGRTARIAQAQEPRHLVIRFAGGVVDRGAEQLDVVRDAADPQDLGVAAGHQQRAHVLRQGVPAGLGASRRTAPPCRSPGCRSPTPTWATRWLMA